MSNFEQLPNGHWRRKAQCTEFEAAPLRIWYMRDDHTFRELPLDVDDALTAIREEFDRGYTYGMLACKPEVVGGVVHANGRENWLAFEAEARPWLERAVVMSQPPAAAAPLESIEARYIDLLQRLGVQGHDGAVAEIEKLRSGLGLSEDSPTEGVDHEHAAKKPEKPGKPEKPLRLFNGRSYAVLPGMQEDAHLYVAAYSMNDARRVCVEAGYEDPGAHEIKVYWNKGAWGIRMDGITPERGLWIARGRSGKPERASPKAS